MSRPEFSTFTHSVGAHTAGHSLPAKLKALADAGFEGVEIFQDDMDAYLSSDEFNLIYKCQTPPESPLSSSPTNRNDTDKMASSSSCLSKTRQEQETAWNAHGRCTQSQAIKEIHCASRIARVCRNLGLKVLTLQPMRDIEGWTSPSDRSAAMNRVKSRFPILRALETDLMIICSNNQQAPSTTGDFDVLANDLREIADAAAAESEESSQSQRPIRIAYEALSWGTHVDKWSQAWDVIQRVNRDNVGICFDSFNTLGREYADPCSLSGMQEPQEITQRALQQSLEAIKSIPADKIFFMQLGDARRLPQPLRPSPSEEEPRPAIMFWSSGTRLYPGEFERGAFLPVTDFVKAVTLGAGYKGPWSIEVFNDSLNDTDSSVPDDHACRGFKGLTWLSKQIYPQ
jgi:4-hydroxyphenylpyruvate dioxygenase